MWIKRWIICSPTSAVNFSLIDLRVPAFCRENRSKTYPKNEYFDNTLSVKSLLGGPIFCTLWGALPENKNKDLYFKKVKEIKIILTELHLKGIYLCSVKML